MIRLLVVVLAIGPLTIWHAMRIAWAVSRNRPDARCVCDDAPRRWSRQLLHLSGATVEVENVEATDPSRPQILVANHVSWFDVLALAASIPGHFVFVAKKELERVPVFSSAARACGHLFIDRRDRAAAVDTLEEARRSLEATSPTVIMFPEGTRSPDGELKAFKKGAFVLAIQTGVDVVPAAICGSREVLRKGSLLIRPGTIRVRFGVPLPRARLQPSKNGDVAYQELAALLRAEVAALAEPSADEPPPPTES